MAIRGLRPDLYPLNLSVDKIRATVRHARDSATDFNMAAFEGGKPVAIGAARVAEMPWFERCEAHVYVLFSERAGAGSRIVKEIMAWYQANPMLRRLIWPMEFDAPVSMMRLAERLGFNSFNTNACHYKV